MITVVIQRQLEIFRVRDNVNARRINGGLCEEFAVDVMETLGFSGSNETPRRFMVWHDSMPDCTKHEAGAWSHCFVGWDELFYDSEAPTGVASWRELPYFRRNPVK